MKNSTNFFFQSSINFLLILCSNLHSSQLKQSFANISGFWNSVRGISLYTGDKAVFDAVKHSFSLILKMA